MAWTRHGHQIPNSPAEAERPNRVARCGGTGSCVSCLRDVADWKPSPELKATEQTILKVYLALSKVGIHGQMAVDAINELQNEGILFLEK